MSILGRLMGTAETAARGRGLGGRTTARPMRGRARPTTGGGLSRGFRTAGRGRPTTAASGGLGGLVSGLMRRR